MWFLLVASGVSGGGMMSLAMLLKLPGEACLSHQSFFLLFEEAGSICEIYVRILEVPIDIVQAAMDHICAAAVQALCV